MNEGKQGYPNLDAAKFLCALLVVVIHTSPLQNASAVAHFYLNDVITRAAVPLFFAISGFLFFRKIDYIDGKSARNRKNFSRLLQTTRKNVSLYVIWSLVYLIIVLPEWYRTGWWGMHVVKDWIHSFLLIGAYYHLWYLLALIAAIPALYLLLMIIPLRKIWIAGSVLWIMECLTYSYAWIGIDRIPLVVTIGSKMPIVFNSLFRAVPLLAIGAVCAHKRTERSSAKRCTGTFFLCAVEASLLYFGTPNEDKFAYLFATPFMTYAVLNALAYGTQIRIDPLWQIRLRDMSLLIYCLHPMIRYVICQLCFPEGIVLWMTVTALSVGTAYLWALAKSCCIYHK